MNMKSDNQKSTGLAMQCITGEKRRGRTEGRGERCLEVGGAPTSSLKKQLRQEPSLPPGLNAKEFTFTGSWPPVMTVNIKCYSAAYLTKSTVVHSSIRYSKLPKFLQQAKLHKQSKDTEVPLNLHQRQTQGQCPGR